MHVLIVENDDHSADLIRSGLNKMADISTTVVPASAEHIQALEAEKFDIAAVVYNISDDILDVFTLCASIKGRFPTIKILIICSPGAAYKKLSLLAENSDAIDGIYTKPIDFESLHKRITSLLLSPMLSGEDYLSADQFKKFFPRGLSATDLRHVQTGDTVVVEKTILFTDLRKSTEMINRYDIHDYIAKLNDYFTIMGNLVTRHDGEVIKYTGDGMLATFSGFARCQLAVKCSADIIATHADIEMPFQTGIGIADGLIVEAFIGPETRTFFDVLGVQVNLAARLCNEAEAGEIIITESVAESSRLDNDKFDRMQYRLKGFESPTTAFLYKP